MTASEYTDPFLRQVVLGRYKIESLLARGGMGSVYVGHDKERNRKVAVKLLRLPHLKSEFARELRDRFIQEANTISKLEDPRTLKLYDFGEVDLGLVMVTELLRGCTLGAAIKASKRISPEALVPILIDITYCLAEAHTAGVVHRDIKPGNLFLHQNLAGDVTTKVLDFGIAKVTDDSLIADPEGTFATQTGYTLGTVAYMSPEQAAATTVGPSSDIYSLGAVAYHALTGRVPFEGSVSEVRRDHMIKSPASFSAQDLRLPHAWEDLEAAVLKCLEKEPRDRFLSARHLRAELERLRTYAGNYKEPAIPKTSIAKRLLWIPIALSLGTGAYIFFTPCKHQSPPKGFVELPTCKDQALFADAHFKAWRSLAENLESRAQNRPEYWLNSALAWGRAEACSHAEAAWVSYKKSCPAPCALDANADVIRTSIDAHCTAQLKVEVTPKTAAVFVRTTGGSTVSTRKNSTGLKPGRYEVLVRSPGHTASTQTIELTKGHHQMELELKRTKMSPEKKRKTRKKSVEGDTSGPKKAPKPKPDTNRTPIGLVPIELED